MGTPKSVINEDALNIYTDGSSYTRPKRGGVGILFVTVDVNGDEVIEDLPLPGYRGSTAPEMELYACVLALKDVLKFGRHHDYSRIMIYTDCQYVRDSHQTAKFQWSQNKWRNRHGRPIEHAELWKELLKLERNIGKRLDIVWIKGHSKNAHNKAADKAAKRSAKNPLNAPLRNISVRRKTSEEFTKVGSVEMLGQELDVRIVTAHWMKTQRVHKYRYQVLSDDSVYFDLLDEATSEFHMGAGHHYKVRLGEDQNHPQFAEVLQELQR